MRKELSPSSMLNNAERNYFWGTCFVQNAGCMKVFSSVDKGCGVQEILLQGTDLLHIIIIHAISTAGGVDDFPSPKAYSNVINAT